MGILRKTEELVPVTCAVLKPDQRSAFFQAIRKKTGGNVRRLAETCSTTTAVVSDWMSGQTNIPFQTLQLMVRTFQVRQPAVSELRRELQAVVQVSKPKAPRLGAGRGAKPARGAAKRERKPREPRRSERKPRDGKRKEPARDKGRAKKVRGPRRREEKKRPPAPKKRPAQPPKKKAAPARDGKGPKLSSELAYWTGVLFARASRDEETIVLRADRMMGQNFASTWAGMTKDLFGVKPDLAMSEDHKAQTASLPAEGLGPFLARLEFKGGTTPDSAPGAPRWAWSNPEWKQAFLKGLVDASARFHRSPALRLTGLSDSLRKSAQKMLSSLKLELKIENDELVLEGKEAVEKYYNDIGTENLKLRDQMKAFFGGGRSGGSRSRSGRSRRGRGRSGRRR